MEKIKESMHSNIIQQTRDIIQNMTQQQRFVLAKRHLMDALNHRIPRSDLQANNSTFFRIVYQIQTSSIWNCFLFFCSFIFMYIIIGEPNNRMHKNSPLNITVVIIEFVIMVLFWLDILFEIYHKYSWKVSWQFKFPQLFQLKLIFIVLLTIDAITYYSLYYSYPVRLFRIIRPFLPYFYNHFARKAFQSFLGVYQDILAYLVFYFSIIFAFGIIGAQVIQLPSGTQFDWFKNNYNDIAQSSFLLYILASFDSWPDYWTLSVDSSKWYYLFYVAFIFLNFFYFVTIPTTVMFNSFKKTRSILMIIDQIQQQNSLLLCFLCLGEDNLCIQSQTFHQFMLYAYRNKLRLIDHIKQISFRLDENQDSDLFVSQFLNLCKVIQQQPDMYPPSFDDWQPYIKFRKFLKKRLHIKKIVNSIYFHIAVILITLANVMVIIVSSFIKQWNNITVQTIFVLLLIIEIIIKLLGHGFERFIDQGGYLLEAGLAGLCILFFALSGVILQSTIIELLSLVRIFRLPLILNTILISSYFKRFYYKSIFLRKLRILFQDLYVSLIVGVKMFPLFMTLYYILGIIGIQAYDQSFLEQQSSPYSFYDEVANFRSFLLSQVVIVQSMVQAGWSMIIFDHAYRFGNTILVYIYFISIHVIIDTTIFSLMKGMVGDLYEAITLDFESLDKQQERRLQHELFDKQKRQQITQIKQNIQFEIPLSCDSLKKKQIYQNKLDLKMLESLKCSYDIKHHRKKRRKPSPIQSYSMIKSKDLLKSKQTKSQPVLDLDNTVDAFVSIKEQSSNTRGETIGKIDNQYSDSQSFNSDENANERCNNFQIDQYFLDRITLKMNEIPFRQKLQYPQFLKQYLKKRLVIAKSKIQKTGLFNPNIMSIKESSSIQFYTSVLQSLLEIKQNQNQRKQQILNSIIKQRGQLNQSHKILAMLSQKQRLSKNLVINPIVRNIMLSGITEDFINKFQLEYFSGVYGNSFRQINSSTLQPLLHHESLMLYGLSRVLRYELDDVYSFWNMVGNIQQNISRTLLEPGSIFTFVFEVEELAGNWFVLELKQDMDIKIRFIKTGIWIYHKKMEYQSVYYGQDIFNCDDETIEQNPESKQNLKYLYNTFETLGLTMFNEKTFFNYDPLIHSYDLFTFLLKQDFKPVSNHASPQKLKPMTQIIEQKDQDLIYKEQEQIHEDKKSEQSLYNIKVSKVMGVILSRQNQRLPQDQLKYKLTDIKKTKLQLQIQKKKRKTFKFDEDDNQTLIKLQQLVEEDSQRVIDYESLEYAYLVETMESIRDICICNYENLIKQAEKVLNIELAKIDSKQ